ncbi:MAG: hypothetical protein ACD_43C00064G0001 [uncultured bacterium]|nr:MAG: hypothetical protein ACD_43C00064G0001 [uncultured bacterium]
MQTLGYIIVAQNWRTKYGELDIIARRGTTIYFFEVKSRSSGRYGLPAEAVNWKKQHNIINTAHKFLQLNKQFSSYRLQLGIISYVNGHFNIIID